MRYKWELATAATGKGDARCSVSSGVGWVGTELATRLGNVVQMFPEVLKEEL